MVLLKYAVSYRWCASLDGRHSGSRCADAQHGSNAAATTRRRALNRRVDCCSIHSRRYGTSHYGRGRGRSIPRRGTGFIDNFVVESTGPWRYFLSAPFRRLSPPTHRAFEPARVLTTERPPLARPRPPRISW